jgi:hypothetical protein
MKLIIDISKDRYDEIMAMDWRNCRRFFDEEIRAIHDGMPQRTGHWIYTNYHTWCCSECGGNPHKGTGFVPNKDEMKMRWKYCNLCGAKMIEPQEESEG